MTFNLQHFDDYTLIEFITDTLLLPEDLKKIDPPDLVKKKVAHKGVVLSGRGPVWLYGFLIHHYHVARFVATYDPRLNGAVVIESHGLPYEAGDLIYMNTKVLE